MEGESRLSWFRFARSPGVLLLALIVLLGVGGYVLTSTTIRHDRDQAAERRARVETVHAQEVLGRARAYVAGLAEVLAREPEPGQARFARWARATSASVGLNDVLWVERVPASQRRRYERRRGVAIVHLTASGRLRRAPAARSYLPAAFTSQTRPELRPGVDVTGFPALERAIRDRTRIFAVGASGPGALGGETGFYLLEAAAFAHGRDSLGYLVAFVPRGWFSTSLGGDPRRVAISEDGQRIEGQLDAVHASAGFEMLGREWRVDVAREPPSGLQSTLPWLALAWPFAVAAVVLPLGRAITLRRRAQRDVERIFALSLDMISVLGFDERFKAVNPAFERTLGYSRQDMLARPYSDFVHRDDVEASREAFAAVLAGDEVSQFENRYICRDGSERWLQWSARAVPEQRVVYCIARDVTERRRVDAELREAQLTAEARGAELHVRAAEQAALRRVATLVAEEATQPEVFSAIADEVGQLLGTQVIRMLRFEDDASAVVVGTSGSQDAHPLGSRYEMEGDSAASRVLRTQQTARIEDYETASGAFAERSRAVGVRSAVGAPIMVEGRLWGAIVAGTVHDEPLPPETETRLGEFTQLMATAIANTEARAEVERLAEEQAALRRVATLVAEGVQPAELSAAVTQEVARLFAEVEPSLVPSIIRFDPGPEFVLVGAAEPMLELPVGSRWGPKDLYVSTRVLRTGRSARVDDTDVASSGGPDADLLRRQGFLYQVGSPIIVEGRLWGAMTMNSTNALPSDTGDRLESFTELVATAIANAESREGLRQLAEEQAALRRVATLVAEGAAAAVVFDAVAAEMERVLDADGVTVSRFEPGTEVTVVGHRGVDASEVPPGARNHEGESVASIVRRTERPARMERHAGTPIVVEGRLWGVVVAYWRGDEAPPPGTEERMGQFAQLLDSAIANVQARSEVERLAEQQAALRRVATMVARECPAEEIFAKVAEEVALLLGLEVATVRHFEPDGSGTIVGRWGNLGDAYRVGSRMRQEGESVTTLVYRTGRSARFDDYLAARAIPADARALGLHGAVASPIVVNGRVWGAIAAGTSRAEPMPADAESRIAEFTELVATAISNVQARSDLAASRARIVAAADQERRRVVRDLHDGAQQRLVHTIVTLGLAQQTLGEDRGEAESLIGEALEHAKRGNAELRELAHGILPAALTHGGLRAGVDAVQARLDLPVQRDVPAERFPAEIEASAYFIVAEALTNVAKHSRAEHVQVKASVEDGMLRVEIRDDGIGGADPDGHGLVGMGDRVTALGGRLEIDSPPGGGTLVAATLPLALERRRVGAGAPPDLREAR